MATLTREIHFGSVGLIWPKLSNLMACTRADDKFAGNDRVMKRLLALLVCVACLYIAYPYLTLWRIERAIRHQDAVTLEALVDWPRVREGIKVRVLSEMSEKAVADLMIGSTGAAALGSAVGTALAAKLVDTIVDGFVSSQGLFQLAEKGAVSLAELQLREFVTYAFFITATQFRVDFENARIAPIQRLTLVMSFSGLEWKVTSLIIPKEAVIAGVRELSVKGDRQVPVPQSPIQLSPEEFSRLRKSIQKCWNPPSGRPAPAVRVRVLLNLDGTLSGNPIVMNSEPNSAFRAAADEAVRAIRQCQPYQMPPASFEAWKDVEVRFDPN
jgi:Protein of unknown function (DUF2939)